MQPGLPQLQRDLREQQRAGDVRAGRMHDALSAAGRRQRYLQRHGVCPNLPDQCASALRRRLHRTDCRVRREVPGRTEILRRQRHVHLDRCWFLLHVERLWRQHALLFGGAMRPMHRQCSVWDQQGLPEQPVRLCRRHMWLHLSELHGQHPGMLVSWAVCSMQHHDRLWQQQQGLPEQPVRLRCQYLRYQLSHLPVWYALL